MSHYNYDPSAAVNMELVGHLAERDELQERQDALLQRIFTLKK